MSNHHIFSCIFSILILMQIRKSITVTYDAPEFPVSERFKVEHTVFEKFNILSKKYKPLDIATGYPDYTPPKNIQNALANAAMSKDYSLDQYSPISGIPRLLNAISKFFLKWSNQTLDKDKNVLVTVGGTEALQITFLTYTLPGDEWIIFEPFHIHYVSMLKASGAILRFIKLKPNVSNSFTFTSADWTFDEKELSSLFNEKTKGILINTPHNPLGKVFTLHELTSIANLAKKWKTLVVSDEVYEFMTFGNSKHIKISTLPGMFKQTITIGSANKLFGATGYRIGWAYGDAKLIDYLKRVHFHTVYCAPSPIQEAIAVGLEKEIGDFDVPSSFINRNKKETEEKRDYLYRILKEAGMTPILPEGGYFLTANWTTINKNVVLDTHKDKCEDFKFAEWLMKNGQIFGLPTSSFYKEVNECFGKDLIRFSIVKAYKTYEKAEKHISSWLLEQ